MAESVAIYARISSDRAGDGLGVARQLEDCRAEAERRGWRVAEEYVDDDLSAYSGKGRPAYQRLLEDVKAGVRDAVIVWHLDRLHRRPSELEEFVETCDAAGLRDLVTLHGEVNLGSGDGLLVARIMAAVAANESHAKSRRIRRKLDEVAQAGRPHGGSQRPFGFEDDKITLRPEEAEVVRQLAARFLAGESLTSLCRWLQDSGVPTSTGKQWRTTTLRGLLRSARISGQREHRGEIVGPAVWPAIIAPEQTAQIRAILDDPMRRTNRTARRYALSGLLRCHLCGMKMVSAPRKMHGRVERRYVCSASPDKGGCGRCYIVAEPLEEWIAEAVLYRLDTPELAAALSGQVAEDAHAAALAEQSAADQAQLEDLAQLYADRAITRAEWITARERIESRLQQARRQLARLTRSTVLDGFIGNAEGLRAQWDGLNLDRQHAIIAAVLEHAVIGRGERGSQRFDPSRVSPSWRL